MYYYNCNFVHASTCMHLFVRILHPFLPYQHILLYILYQASLATLSWNVACQSSLWLLMWGVSLISKMLDSKSLLRIIQGSNPRPPTQSVVASNVKNKSIIQFCLVCSYLRISSHYTSRPHPPHPSFPPSDGGGCWTGCFWPVTAVSLWGFGWECCSLRWDWPVESRCLWTRNHLHLRWWKDKEDKNYFIIVKSLNLI